MEVVIFCFNAFQENTYLLYDDSGECIIIDPGCNTKNEEDQLINFIENAKLTPVKLVNTHCHIDHILGNKFISEKYNLPLIAHKGEKPVLESGVMVSEMYGIEYKKSPDISAFLDEGDTLEFGNSVLEILFTPGHSPASISLFHRQSKQLIAGDVLFQGSIGRTDLPGGNFETLIDSIKSKYYPLGDDVIVYPGHGPATQIGIEKSSNPFLNA